MLAVLVAVPAVATALLTPVMWWADRARRWGR